METWDVYDNRGRKTGRTMVRGRPIPPGDFHLVVHIWPSDGIGRLLIQRRSDHLAHLPGVWAATGGSALAGEDSLTAALRETEEELGLRLDPARMRNLGRVFRRDNFVDVWTAPVNPDVTQGLALGPEVAEVDWATLPEILERTRQGTFHRYQDDIFRLLAEGLEP